MFSMGLDVEVLWERDKSEKAISGEEVRSLIAEGGHWQHLVPPAAARIISSLGLDRKIRETLESGGK